MVGPVHQLERIFNAAAMSDSQAQHVNQVKFVFTVTPWPWSSQLIRISQLVFHTLINSFREYSEVNDLKEIILETSKWCKSLDNQLDGHFTVVLSVLVVLGTQSFTYFGHRIWWSAAKLFCDCHGHLAVLDTAEQQQNLLQNT